VALTPERKEQLIEAVAKWIVENDLGFPSELFLEVFKPMAFTLAQMGIFYIGPLLTLSTNLDEQGTELARLLEREENWTRIVKRVRELKAEREVKSKAQKKEIEGGSIFDRVKRFLWG